MPFVRTLRFAPGLAALIALFQLVLVGPAHADDIVPNRYYELSNKEISKRHYSFVIQESFGGGNGVHSWMDVPAERGYNRKAAQWQFIKAPGGPNDVLQQPEHKRYYPLSN